MQSVALINYGSGNLRSAEKALIRAADGKSEIVVTDDPDVIANADRIVLLDGRPTSAQSESFLNLFDTLLLPVKTTRRETIILQIAAVVPLPLYQSSWLGK